MNGSLIMLGMPGGAELIVILLVLALFVGVAIAVAIVLSGRNKDTDHGPED